MSEEQRKANTEEQIEEEAQKLGQLIDELRAALEENSLSYDDLMKVLPEARKLVSEQRQGVATRRRVP